MTKLRKSNEHSLNPQLAKGELETIQTNSRGLPCRKRDVLQLLHSFVKSLPILLMMTNIERVSDPSQKDRVLAVRLKSGVEQCNSY